MRGPVVIEHEIDDVGGRGDENKFEQCIPGRVIKSPEEIYMVPGRG